MGNLIFFDEPNLLFRFNQGLPDPRDGLSMFGPLDAGKPAGIRLGIAGTKDGIRRATTYLRGLQAPVFAQAFHRNRPFFRALRPPSEYVSTLNRI